MHGRLADVVLVSHEADLHGDALMAAIGSRGLLAWRTALGEFERETLVWHPDRTQLIVESCGIEIHGRTPALFRRPGLPRSSVSDPDEADAVSEEAQACFEGVLEDLQLRWVDSPNTIRLTENKLYQFGRVLRSGIPIPRYLVTSDADAAARFVAGRRIVVKPMAGGTIEGRDGRRVLFTTEFWATEEMLRAVEVCPVLLQELIDTVSDFRIVTVGKEAFVFQRDRRAGEPIDWREGDPAGEDFVRVLDPDAGAMALQAAAVLGLRYSAQDWVRGADGSDWFLDANPAGQWLFLPEAEMITRSVVNLICHAA